MKKKCLNLRVSLSFTMLFTACTLTPVAPKTTDLTNRDPSSSRSDNIKMIALNAESGKKPNLTVFDLNTQIDALEAHLTELLKKSDDAKSSGEEKGESYAFSDAMDFFPTDKGYRESVKTILDRISKLKSTSDENEKNQLLFDIKLISHALNNKYEIPYQYKYEVFLLPIYVGRFTSHPDIKTDRYTKDPDASPEHSYLWSANPALPKMNLYSFHLKNIDQQICSYEKAKNGWGTMPGFHIKCDTESYKLKFGNETNSGPFNSRIYNSLGYHTSEVNYLAKPQVLYDRKIFTEFNHHKVAQLQVTLLGKKIKTLNDVKHLDAFGYVTAALLKNGERVPIAELKQLLLKPEAQNLNRDYFDADFNADFEEKIKLLEFSEASIITKTDDVELGPWKLDAFDFSKRREFKALLVLSAWVGNADVRTDNNRLILSKSSGNKKAKEILLSVQDTGYGLGQVGKVFKRTSSEINDMPWAVTRTIIQQDNGDREGRERLEMTGFIPFETSKTFENVNLADAEWMLRQMCQIQPAQLEQALLASGLSSAAIKLAAAKLLSSRNQMIVDFKLQNELGSSCLKAVDQKMNYAPAVDGSIVITLQNGETVTAPDLGEVVQNGKLVKK